MAILTAFVILSKFVGMKMPGFAISGSEKFFRWHRLSSRADRLAGGDARPTKFSGFTGGQLAHEHCSEKSFVGCVSRTN